MCDLGEIFDVDFCFMSFVEFVDVYCVENGGID